MGYFKNQNLKQSLKQSLKQIGAMIHARNLEFFRDKAALSWTMLFPFVLILGMYFGMSDFSTYHFKVGVIGEATQVPIADLKYVKYIKIQDKATGLKSLKQFGVDFLIDPLEKNYWFNEKSKEGYFLDKLVQENLAGNLFYTRIQLENIPVRYVDWFGIGILVINIMYGCLYGIGYVIVRYRKNGHLKRLQVTPITVSQFLIAQVVSRIGIIFVSSSVVILGCFILLKPVLAEHLDYISLGLVFILGILSFISLGLLLCSRVTSEELSRGIIEMVSWPMLICSGAWFSLEGTHPWLQNFASLLPATHFIEGLRQIALYGATFSEILPHVMMLAGSTLVFFLLGIGLFKWQNKE